jgi:hypothetical protein
MTSFLEKVEAYIRKDGTESTPRKDKAKIKPAKGKKSTPLKGKGHIAPFKPNKANKPKKARRFDGVSLGEDQFDYGKTTKKASTNFVHLRDLMAAFEQAMQRTDPFNLTDDSWLAFFKEMAPKVIVTLLWDTKHIVRPEDRKKLMLLFRQHIRG